RPRVQGSEVGLVHDDPEDLPRRAHPARSRRGVPRQARARDRRRPPAPDRVRRRGAGDDSGHRGDPCPTDPDEAVKADRYAIRRGRALEAADAAGLAGILVSPGPGLAYLTGYTPLPLERLTLLVLSGGTDPTLVVPTLEGPPAGGAAGGAPPAP